MTNFEQIHRWPPSCSPRTAGNYFSSQFRYSVPWPEVYECILGETINDPPTRFTDGCYLEMHEAIEGEPNYTARFVTFDMVDLINVHRGISPELGPAYVMDQKTVSQGGDDILLLRQNWGDFWDGFDGTEYATDVASRFSFNEIADDPPRWAFVYNLRPRQWDWERPF